MCKNEQYTYEHPKIEYYTDKNGIVHEVRSHTFENSDGDLIPCKQDFYTDEHGVMHSFYVISLLKIHIVVVIIFTVQ